VASFIAAALSLATYNTVQISKLETAIEAQQAKTDLLTNISKLHECHLHKLESMIEDIGHELQVVKVENIFRVKVERVLAQVNTDEHKLKAVVATFERIIITAFNQKLAPGGFKQ
jgi:CRISPR/Cas system-associated protein Cas5 (RAMP superfamily)